MANQTTPPGTMDPLAVSVQAATRASGLGRTRLYEAIGTGELPSCKVGKRRLILLEDLRAWLDRQRHTGTRSRPTSAAIRSPAEAPQARCARAGAGR